MSKCKIQKNDIFYTPSDVVDDCMKLISISIKESDILLDPFLGNGAFYNKFPDINTKFWCEIEKGVGFFDYNQKIDWRHLGQNTSQTVFGNCGFTWKGCAGHKQA